MLSRVVRHKSYVNTISTIVTKCNYMNCNYTSPNYTKLINSKIYDKYSNINISVCETCGLFLYENDKMTNTQKD